MGGTEPPIFYQRCITDLHQPVLRNPAAMPFIDR